MRDVIPDFKELLKSNGIQIRVQIYKSLTTICLS